MIPAITVEGDRRSVETRTEMRISTRELTPKKFEKMPKMKP